MGHSDEENVVVEPERCDTPTTFENGDTQPRFPLKPSPQSENRRSTSTKNFPLGPVVAHPPKGIKVINSTILTSTPVKKTSSRPVSPIKTPGSRPRSRPSSPLKRTPAPGTNERLVTTPTGFRYTIELPESKIVPRKDSVATPSRSNASTPVKKLGLAEAPPKQISPKRSKSPAKDSSPRKELPKTRAASPEKNGSVKAVHGAEPTPADTISRSHKKRSSVKLTKTNGVHAGTPTVEVTKEDIWAGVQLKSPFDSEAVSVETQVNGGQSHQVKREPGVESCSPSQTSLGHQHELKAEVDQTMMLPGKQSTSRVATNFGEMLRNSSQTAVKTRSSFSEEALNKMFASPTVLDQARHNSERRSQPFVDVVTRPKFERRSLTLGTNSPVTKDFASAIVKGAKKDSAEPSPTETWKASTQRRVSFASTPCTPIGTPTAIMVAIESDMSDIRNSLRRSLGNSYAAVPVSPDITRWLGTSTNGRSPPEVLHATDAKNIGNTPRRNLNERMVAAKQDVQPKPSRSTLQTKDKLGSRLPRPSPTKSKAPLRTPGTIPQAPRTSPFDVRMPGSVPAMASHRARYTRTSEKNGETVGFASAGDIAKQVEEWNTPVQKQRTVQTSAKVGAKTPVKKTLERSKSTLGFMRPTTTSAKKEKGTSELHGQETEKESYTPPGSPSLPQPSRTSHTVPLTPKTKEAPSQPSKKGASPIKNPKVRALASAAPRTPLPRGKAGSKLDRGALRTPSKEMVSKLDKEIDAHLEDEARAGRVFTPSGQRISDLLARKREGGNV